MTAQPAHDHYPLWTEAHGWRATCAAHWQVALPLPVPTEGRRVA